jgi:c-di-GMP-binding flagellar brake protein YcgR
MFQDTQPAPLGDDGGLDRFADFRVSHPREILALLRQVRDASVAVNLNAPDGGALTSTLWALDDGRRRLSFSADDQHPQLQPLIAADEAVAVAYLDSVKLQFDLRGLLLVRSTGACALQAEMPAEVYRFQRRQAYRVRTPERGAPIARLRHPSLPEMTLSLRVIDVSIGGCALFMPHDVPPLQPGTLLSEVQIELDADTRFPAALTLQHVSAIPPNERGLRLGCEWAPLGGSAERALQRYIDQTQKRRRLLQGGL